MGRELLKQLRIKVAIAWVVSWNALLVLGIWVGGSWDFKSIPARVLLMVALLGTTGLLLGIGYSGAVQSVALRTQDNVAAVRKDLWFFVLLMGAMAIATFISFFAE